jgi:hypothetical protein
MEENNENLSLETSIAGRKVFRWGEKEWMETSVRFLIKYF